MTSSCRPRRGRCRDRRASRLARGPRRRDLASTRPHHHEEAGAYPIVLVSYLIGCRRYTDPARRRPGEGLPLRTSLATRARGRGGRRRLRSDLGRAATGSRGIADRQSQHHLSGVSLLRSAPGRVSLAHRDPGAREPNHHRSRGNQMPTHTIARRSTDTLSRSPSRRPVFSGALAPAR